MGSTIWDWKQAPPVARFVSLPAQTDRANEARPARLVVYALHVLPDVALGLACAALLAPPVRCRAKLKPQRQRGFSHRLGAALCTRHNRRTQRTKLEALIGVPVCRPRYRALFDRALRDDVMFNENYVLLRSEKAIRCRHFRLSDCQSQNFRRFFGFVMAYRCGFGVRLQPLHGATKSNAIAPHTAYDQLVMVLSGVKRGTYTVGGICSKGKNCVQPRREALSIRASHHVYLYQVIAEDASQTGLRFGPSPSRPQLSRGSYILNWRRVRFAALA